MATTVPRYQINAHTKRGGNLQFMREAADILGASSDINILSFGCSSGEECLDLADVFENSQVRGVDVNVKALEQAKDISHPRVSIGLSTVENIASGGPYSLITVMSVLCRHPLPADTVNIAKVLPFASFAETIRLFDENLERGGLICLYNSMYFFEDAGISERYRPVCDSQLHSGWIPKYYPDGEPATSVALLRDGVECDLFEWVTTSKPNQTRLKESVAHTWLNSSACLSRKTDVWLWVKTA